MLVQEVQETQVQALNREDPLEEEMATHTSILAWNIPWTEEPGGLQSMGSQKRQNLVTKQQWCVCLCVCNANRLTILFNPYSDPEV